jgi:hypothetical protein
MPSRLTDIHVRRISFVGKAAVRDPQDPTQPRRLLLLKADDNPRKDTPTMSAHTNLTTTDFPSSAAQHGGFSDAQRGKLDAILHMLSDDDHPQLTALRSKVDALRHPGPEAEALMKFNGCVTELRKAEPTLTRTEAMERVRKDDPKLERELSAALRGVGAAA